MRLLSTVTCLSGCGWTFGPADSAAAADIEARRHTGDGLRGGPRHSTHMTTAPAGTGAVREPTTTEKESAA